MKFDESEFEKLSKEDIYELLKYFPTNQLCSWLNHKVLGIKLGDLAKPVEVDVRVKIYNITPKNCYFSKSSS